MPRESENQFDGYQHLDEIALDLMGQTMFDCNEDQAGTYFDRDHWVSAEGIAQALVKAYEAGREQVIMTFQENQK